MIYNELTEKINSLQNRADEISDSRISLLKEFAGYISEKLKTDNEINLIFICTHNSRRSHISQIWAQAVAEYKNISNIKCYSGGTEATAFNPRAVKALGRAGFRIEKRDESKNPIYMVYYSNDKEPIECFSKVYYDKFNPQTNFAAIMTCSDADENCPVVFGAEARFPIRYDDPKIYDGTELEEEKYFERADQIALEMVYAFSLIDSTL